MNSIRQFARDLWGGISLTLSPLWFLDSLLGKWATAIGWAVSLGLIAGAVTFGAFVPPNETTIIYTDQNGSPQSVTAKAPTWHIRVGAPSSVMTVLLLISGIRLVARRRRLTTPVLKINFTKPEYESGTYNYRFKVENPTAYPIKRCYGKYREYKMISSGKTGQLPFDGMPLVWDWRVHKSDPEADIGSFSSELLTFGVDLPSSQGAFAHVMGRDVSGNPNALSHVLYEGDYEFEVEIGSLDSAFPPTITRWAMSSPLNGQTTVTKIVPAVQPSFFSRFSAVSEFLARFKPKRDN